MTSKFSPVDKVLFAQYCRERFDSPRPVSLYFGVVIGYTHWLEQLLPRVQVELQALITEREAMVAENKRREDTNRALAYGEDSFLELAARIRTLLPPPPSPELVP